MLDLDKCDTPHFHETLKINMSLMIEKRTIDSSKNFQNAEHNKFFIMHSCISWSWSLQ